MTPLEPFRRCVLPALLLALALAPAATAQPIACQGFESGKACGWYVGPGCNESVCSGSCKGDYCSCDPQATFAFLQGDWSGTWHDTRYNVSGAAHASFDVTCAGVAATGSINLGEIGLGEETGSGSGTVSAQTLTFDFSAATVGSGMGTLSAADNTGSGSGSVTYLDFGAFTFTGSVSPTTISGTFDFTSPTGGEGTISATKD